MTIFPEGKGKAVIQICPWTPVCHVAEIIAHECAHAITGFDAGHDDRWDAVFSSIQHEYHRICEAMDKPGMKLEVMDL